MPTQDSQSIFDVAVVMTTVVRPTILRAVQSVFAQDLKGRIQLMIGVDKILGNPGDLQWIIENAPDHVLVTIINPGYSTSARHGGLYSNYFGGSIYTALSYLSNSRYVAYLDDDDWWAPNHLSSLLTVVRDGKKAWGFSFCWYVNPQDLQPICVDEWESIGPGAGVYAQKLGGHCKPDTILLDKLACHRVLPAWCLAMFQGGDGNDRTIFDRLLKEKLSWAGTGLATAYYVIRPDDEIHPHRVKWMESKGYDLSRLPVDKTRSIPRV